MSFATLNGRDLTDVDLHVGQSGPWFVDVRFLDSDDVPSGTVSLVVGTLELVGTIEPSTSGRFADGVRARVLAGGGGWGREIQAKGYHNDAGVKGRTVASDAAISAGESFSADDYAGVDRVGADYVRQAGPASRALDDVSAGTVWYVDYSGVTHVGARPVTTHDAEKAPLLRYNPASRIAEFGATDPADLSVGMTVTDSRLGTAPLTIRSLQFTSGKTGLRARAWLGDDATSASRIVQLVAAIVGKLSDRLDGVYRYRFVRLAVDGRYDLQAVSSRPGLPDLLTVDAWGAGGYHVEPVAGCECLVAFIDGDRGYPILLAWPGFARPGHVPSKVKIAGGGGPIARVGSTVTLYLPPAIPISGTLDGVPFTGVLNATAPGVGVVDTGSAEGEIS